jgi:hypothetical protein
MSHLSSRGRGVKRPKSRDLKVLTYEDLAKIPLPVVPPESVAEGLTWAMMVEDEPRLGKLLKQIEKTDTSKDRSCRVVLWYTRFKPKMVRLVGVGAPRRAPERLRTSRAYDLAYRRLFYDTPPCRCPGCNAPRPKPDVHVYA